jgi:hypothetical protein
MPFAEQADLSVFQYMHRTIHSQCNPTHAKTKFMHGEYNQFDPLRIPAHIQISTCTF